MANPQRLTGGHVERFVPEEGGVEEVRPAFAVRVGAGAPVEGDGVTAVAGMVEQGDAGRLSFHRAGDVAPRRAHAEHPVVLRAVGEEDPGVDQLAAPAEREAAVATPSGERRAVEPYVGGR